MQKSHPKSPSKYQHPKHKGEKWKPSDPTAQGLFLPSFHRVGDQKFNSFFCQYGDKFGALDEPILPCSSVHSGTGKPQPPAQERDLCWLQRQLENPSASGKPWKRWGIIITVKMIGRSRAALTPGFTNTGGQISTWGAPLRPSLNLVLELRRGKHELLSLQEWAPRFLWLPTLFSILLQPHSQGFWACVPRQGDANSYWGLEGRKSWFLMTTAHTNPHVWVPPHCDHGTTTAFQGFSMFLKILTLINNIIY